MFRQLSQTVVLKSNANAVALEQLGKIPAAWMRGPRLAAEFFASPKHPHLYKGSAFVVYLKLYSTCLTCYSCSNTMSRPQ